MKKKNRMFFGSNKNKKTSFWTLLTFNWRCQLFIYDEIVWTGLYLLKMHQCVHCALANTVLVRHVCNYYLVGAIFQPNQFSLQSVLQQASSIMSSGDDHLLTTIQEHYTMAGQLISLTKKQGVSGKNVNF